MLTSTQNYAPHCQRTSTPPPSFLRRHTHYYSAITYLQDIVSFLSSLLIIYDNLRVFMILALLSNNCLDWPTPTGQGGTHSSGVWAYVFVVGLPLYALQMKNSIWNVFIHTSNIFIIRS